MTSTLPELAPQLPALVAAPGPVPPFAADLAPARLALASRLIVAAAAARAGDPVETVLGPAVWEAAWMQACRDAAEALVAARTARCTHAAAEARLSRRRRAAVLGPVPAVDALARQLSRPALPFFEELARLETATESADTRGHAFQPDRIERLARRLDEAWRALETVAETVQAAHVREADAIRTLRPSPWPFVLASVLVVGVALWVGLVLGGYLPVPPGARSLAEFAWGLR